MRVTKRPHIMRGNKLTDIIGMLTLDLASENNIPVDQARTLVAWLETEGVLDFVSLKETYEGVRE